MTSDRKAQDLSAAIEASADPGDAELRELVEVARLRQVLGAARRAEAERHRQQVWQRLTSVREDK